MDKARLEMGSVPVRIAARVWLHHREPCRQTLRRTAVSGEYCVRSTGHHGAAFAAYGLMVFIECRGRSSVE